MRQRHTLFILLLAAITFFTATLTPAATAGVSLTDAGSSFGSGEYASKMKSAKKEPNLNKVKPVQGMLTNEKLIEYGIDKCKKLMIVAHPDDEILWGGDHLLSKGYFILCLSKGDISVRRKEFYEVLDATGNKGVILEYTDWSKSLAEILGDIKLVMGYKRWKTIVTHNPDGEYGHIRHIKTNRYVTFWAGKQKSSGRLWYFGRYHSPGHLGSLRSAKKVAHLKKKKALLKMYKSQKSTIKKFYHMVPYEKWVKKSKW